MKFESVEHMYQVYLEKVNLDESKMHPVQKEETKRAFYGALGQMVIFMDNVADLPEEEGATAIIDFRKEVSEFWAQFR